ncbi:hypothetical protein CDEST_14378 [Colletotrichum destructivum]|uniref:Uncharacterized protein n=1 Tax=Colletotrichum destructivum TaxID=34406 RepID=A0AAX4J1E0_9PEZI|nr:hypothetical protein CDEST_14378 [Colletotrichum destructivum]
MIDPFDYKITAKGAWNAHDTTPNRLYLNQILMALWEDDGLSPGELVSVEFSWIVNEPTKDAIASARARLGLSNTEDFRITDSSSVWSGLMNCPFGKVAQRMAEEAGKDVVLISVTDSGLDDMAFELA